LQKFFSYPGGAAGLGLLLLRGLVGLTLIAQSVGHIRSTNLSLAAGVVVALAVVSGACLLAGFMTQLFAGLIGIGYGALCLLKTVFATFALVNLNYGDIDLFFVTIALILLGPGALSCDSRMFGRREIRIPPASKGLESGR
jgi:uncharacterized membrane protein YphA (DoxX/SURF4 family)